ncbi:hypothetical protein ACEUAX_20050 [Aeromonas veronii]
MAKLAGLYLHLDIPFDEIEEYEAALFPKSTIKQQLPQPLVTATLGAF